MPESDETTTERTVRRIESVLFGKVAWASLAIVLLIAAVVYWVR